VSAPDLRVASTSAGPPGLTVQLVARVGRLALDVTLAPTAGTLAVVGPNGAGKTSLLLLLLGVLAPARGRVALGDRVLYDAERGVDVPVEARRIGYVPQDYALFPHLDVRGNVEFALARSPSRPKRDARVARALSVLRDLGIDHLSAHLPETLSGGEKQRVALARALSVEPHALVLDEPLSALDVHARREVRAFLGALLRKLAIPTLIVTHDPDDARLLGDRIAVMDQGRVVQCGAWDELVRSPATPFVAELVSQTR